MGAYRARHSRNPPTPSSFRAAPNQQGNSFRDPIISVRSASVSSPVSRYRSSTASSQTAASSRNASSRALEKSTTPDESFAFSCSSTAARSAPARSILLIKRKAGTWYRSSRRQRVRVWAWTPSVPLMTRMAQSSTWRVRSASAEKSTWPGVSSRVISVSPHRQHRLLGEDGDAPLPLHGVRVQKGIPVVHPSQAPQGAALIEQRLGQRGLPRVHMGQYSDDQLLHVHTPSPPCSYGIILSSSG